MDELFIGTIPPLWDRLFNPTKLGRDEIIAPLLLPDRTDPCLLHADAFFLLDARPNLVSSPSDNTQKVHANRIDVGHELLTLSRWLLFSAHPSSTPARISEAFVSLLVNFCVIEFRRLIDRIRFQSEDALASQLPTLWDFFGTLAAVIVVSRSTKRFSVSGLFSEVILGLFALLDSILCRRTY